MIKKYTTITINININQDSKTAAILANIFDESGGLVNNGIVVFKCNNKLIGMGKVLDGCAFITYHLPSDYETKQYTITTEYRASQQYYNSTEDELICSEE